MPSRRRWPLLALAIAVLGITPLAYRAQRSAGLPTRPIVALAGHYAPPAPALTWHEYGWRLPAARMLAGTYNRQKILTCSTKDLLTTVGKRLITWPLAPVPRLTVPPGYLALDLHTHGLYSHDSLESPEQMLLAAAQRGLSGIAITDHDVFGGVAQVQQAATQLKAQGRLPADFLIIPGEEVGSNEGHIVALFTTQAIPKKLSATETIARIHAQGGIAVAAHPLIASGVGELAKQLPFDAVELENSAQELSFLLAGAARQQQRRDFYAGVTKPLLGGSDGHDPLVLGLCYTLVQCPPNAAAVRVALLAGRGVPVCRLTAADLRAAPGQFLLAGWATLTSPLVGLLHRPAATSPTPGLRRNPPPPVSVATPLSLSSGHTR
ncbi:MAG TPA: PHP domain-containing protein [Armatimonadota bacterium]